MSVFRPHLRSAILWAVIALLGTNRAQSQPSELVVEIDAGRILGVMEDGVRAFKGIPYAAPPIGPLRWKPPHPVEAWAFALQADSYGPKCMQPRFPAPWNRGQSEDCLFLNVWTGAEESDEPLPVIVWIHGGGFTYSSAASAVHNGASLAGKGAVVVTLNYRLGPLGFLAHPQLSAESEHGVSGNYGILDQIAALQWVQRNIAAFGGDPERVTIGGESAGAQSVAVLLASPLARGLFHRAIGQSGVGFLDGMTHLRRTAPDEPSAEEIGVAVCEAAGAASIDELRALAAERIIDAVSNLPADQEYDPEPIVDGWVLPAEVRLALEAEQSNGVPILVGSNADEGTIFMNGETYPESLEAYKALLESRYGKSAESFSGAYPVLKEEDIRGSLLNAYRDSKFSLTARTWARLVSRGGADAYLYFFRRAPPNFMGEDFGAHHGAEVAYAFDNLHQPVMENHPDQTDRMLADAMSSYWVSFAATGHPEAPGQATWEPYDFIGEPFLELGDTIRAGRHLLKAQLDFWERFLARSP